MPASQLHTMCLKNNMSDKICQDDSLIFPLCMCSLMIRSVTSYSLSEPASVFDCRPYTCSAVTWCSLQSAPSLLLFRSRGCRLSIARANFASAVRHSSNSSNSAVNSCFWSSGSIEYSFSFATSSLSFCFFFSSS